MTRGNCCDKPLLTWVTLIATITSIYTWVQSGGWHAPTLFAILCHLPIFLTPLPIWVVALYKIQLFTEHGDATYQKIETGFGMITLHVEVTRDSLNAIDQISSHRKKEYHFGHRPPYGCRPAYLFG